MTDHQAALPPGFIPSRHRENREQVRGLLGALYWLMPREAEPSPALWREMGEALMHGDPPMDRLVDWMFARGLSKTRAQFEQAIERGIESVSDAEEPLRAFFALVDKRPSWVDDELVRQGGELYRRGGMEVVYAGRDVAFLGGYQASAFNKTLLLTGAMSKGPTRRLAETLSWALDCTAEGGMERFGPGWKSTLRVRFIHGLVRRHVQRLPEWQMAEWGLPINQIDMAATLLGTVNVPILGARILGMPQSRSERDAATHSGRYIGWLMGIEPRWLATDERSALLLLYQLLLSLSNPDQTSIELARPMADEPLQRPYENFAALRGRFDRARHLSISRFFLGRTGMRNLGLSPWTLPWYPLLSLPRTLSRHLWSRLTPDGKQQLAIKGRRAQEDFLRMLSGKHAAIIGQAASALH